MEERQGINSTLKCTYIKNVHKNPMYIVHPMYFSSTTEERQEMNELIKNNNTWNYYFKIFQKILFYIPKKYNTWKA